MNPVTMHLIMNGADRSAKAAAWRTVLGIAAGGYRMATSIRNWTFDANLRRADKLGRPVISVGNITAGGTGKTPMVIELARRLVNSDHHPAILTRGYKSRQGLSDEAMLFADEFGAAVPVAVNADRVAGAKAVLEDHQDVDVFLLDDGFQHRQVARDLDLVLIDATEPFGFGHVLPRGLLREPIGRLKRAGAVIITRSDQVGSGDLDRLEKRVAAITGFPPIAHAVHAWTGYLDQHDQPHSLDHLSSARVVGVCGIANPSAFTQSLARQAPNLLAQGGTFPDHHAYDAKSLLQFMDSMIDQENPDAFVTTAKDWVKWRNLLKSDDWPRPVYRPTLEIRFTHGHEAIDALLDRLIG